MHSTALDAAAPRPGRLAPLAQALRAHVPLAVIVALYAAAAFALGRAYPTPGHSEKLSVLAQDFLKMLPSMAYFVLMWRFWVMRRVVRPADGKAWLKADLRALVTDPARLANGLVASLLMVGVLVSFAQIKKLIPVIQPFAWDETLARLDATLHFGWQPWELAHAVFGHPLIVTAVTGAYNFWMFVMYFVLLATCFSTSHPAQRMRYLVAFILCWAVGGNLFAAVFSSAGPAYYARLGLGDLYAPLMALLQDHAAHQPLSVLETQDLLWAYYAAPDSLNGISAFPSMHVGSTVLMALYGFSLNRRLGQALTVFAAVILMGSVLLGWHYAVDGYAGALIAVLAWAAAGALVRRFPAVARGA